MKKNVVVIGSGLAGSLICNELADTANVTLLEVGAQNGISYPRLNFVKKRLAPFNTFCFGAGGGSNLWHNGLIPIDNKDVASQEFAQLLLDAKPYMDKAAANLFFPEKSFTREYSQTVSEMSKWAEKVGVFDEGIDCLIYPKKFRKLTIDSKVNSHFLVDTIDFKAHGRRITEVEYSVGAVKNNILTDAVIICAGTFGSPKLVKKVQRTLGEEAPRVGHGLIDHPAGFVGKVRFNKEIADSMHRFALLDKGEYTSCTGARLKSACGQYTCFAFFRPAITMSNRLSLYQYKSKLGGSSGLKRIKNALSFKLFHPDILIEILAHVFRTNVRSRTFNILVYFQQRRGENNVSYDAETLNIDWNVTAKEIEIYNEILAKLNSSLTPIAQKLSIQSPITEEWLRSGAHHSGTISFGGANDDLVDTDLKLKCSDNAYVCDGSIIQEHSYANTGLTIGQLALRLANKISGAL